MTSTPEPPHEPEAPEPVPSPPPRQRGPRSERRPPAAPPPQGPPLPLPADPLRARERNRRPSKATDYSLRFIALTAFVFGVALHAYVALSFLDDESEATPQTAAEPTQTPADAAPSATPQIPPTPTPLPDRTNCDEIRGTQYRSVTEREFFLANCTTGGWLPPAVVPVGSAEPVPV